MKSLIVKKMVGDYFMKLMANICLNVLTIWRVEPDYFFPSSTVAYSSLCFFGYSELILYLH